MKGGIRQRIEKDSKPLPDAVANIPVSLLRQHFTLPDPLTSPPATTCPSRLSALHLQSRQLQHVVQRCSLRLPSLGFRVRVRSMAGSID